MSKAITYVLRSLKDGKTYVGSTTDKHRRIQEHNSGEVAATRNRRPLTLLHTEEYTTIAEARIRERFLKTGSGRRQLRKIIENLQRGVEQPGPPRQASASRRLDGRGGQLAEPSVSPYEDNCER